MAKTDKSVYGSNGFAKLVISSAIVSAIAGISTAETITISLVTEKITQTKMAERKIAEDYVIGDPQPILDQENRLSPEEYKVTLYYTQGKESVGTDTLDPYSDIIRPIHENGSLSLQHIWSVGGATGDEQESTSATETFIKTLGKPVFADGKLRVEYTIVTTPTTVATVS